MAVIANPESSAIQVDVHPGTGSPIQAERLKQLYLELLNLRLRAKKRPNVITPSTLNWGPCLAACTIDLRSDDITIQPDWQTAARTKHKLTDAARLVLATGAALAYAKQKKSNVAVVFCSQSCLPQSQGLLTFAAESLLPIIYVTLGEESRSIRERGERTTRLRVTPAAIPVDAGDAVAVYRVAHESIEKARRGAGPTLINCLRSRAEQNGGTLRRFENAIHQMENYLRKKDLWPVKPDSPGAQFQEM
jgi:hypothetical protein